MAERQRGRGGFPANGFTIIELLVVVAIIAILILLLLPAVSYSRPQVLADGVVLYHGEPIDGVGVYLRPVLENGTFGDLVFGRVMPDGDAGRFEVITTSGWRTTNPTTGPFVVNLYLEPELLTDDEVELRTLEAWLEPETSPLRIQIPDGGVRDLKIEIASAAESVADSTEQ